MDNIKTFNFKDIVSSDYNGHLSAIESGRDIPFDIKRVYYITRVPPGVERGFHSHQELHQILLCLNGSVKIRVSDGKQTEVLKLSDPAMGLYIGPMIWREMFDFTEGSVLLVLASDYYDEYDYIRDYDSYLIKASDYYGR